MNRLFQRSVFFLSLGLLATLLVGEFCLQGVHAGTDQDGAYRQMRVYEEVLKKIQTDYVTEPNMNDVTDGALHGLLESLDADSSYLTPSEYKVYKDHSNVGTAQIGLSVSKRGGYATIITVVPGSPADHEHLTDGDVIESINDHSTREMSLAVIRMLLEGKPGTQVTLSVIRPRKSDPDKLSFVRVVTIEPALGEEELENNSILHLKPGILTMKRVAEVGARIKAVEKAGPQKILLDLRDVAEGDDKAALLLANYFIKDGTLATLEGQRFPKQTFTADPGKYLTDAPVEVLVNRGTAGAAELVAVALGDTKRADVVGERTFGEGGVQKTLELPDGAALLLTVAKYEGPSGKKIEDEAVAPTVLVTLPLEEEIDDTPAKTDRILDKGVSVLKDKKN